MEKFYRKTVLNLLIFLIMLILGCETIYTQDAQTYYKNGYIYFTQGNYEKAEQNYKNAVELDPNFEDAHYWLGKVYKQTGDYSRAVEQWKKVLKINPKNPYAFSYLIGSFQSTSRVKSDKASDYLNEGIKIIGNPEEYLIKQDAPSVDLLLSATPYFKKAISLEPNLLEAYFWLGEIYWVLGDKSTSQFRSLAIENYEKAIGIEEATNSVSFNHPSAYWRSYIQLSKIYNSLKWVDKEEQLWLRLEKARALPYQQALDKKGYFGFGYPSRIDVRFTEGDKIENWIYTEKNITFVVINGEVQGEKEKEEEQQF
ncbi:MAG TPA: hypothetical protein DEG96_07830 [Candidatus Atribacteria bacterium]|nr:hypothetical protein [Candidatus Atribacteria bacterium]